MKKAMRSFSACQTGSTAIEYALIAVIVSISMILTASHIGTEAKGMYEYIITSIKASETE